MTDNSAFDDILAHWRSLPVADGAKLPAKSALSPETLKPHLGNIGIFERIERYDLRVRLFGTHLDESFGKAMTGANIFDLHALENRDFYADYYASLLDTPAGARMVREAFDASDNIIRGESLGLPMTDEDGDARFIVGVMLLVSDSILDDPLDIARLNLAKVTSVSYLDIGYGLPANPPALPG